jgi:hypothetical protein
MGVNCENEANIRLIQSVWPRPASAAAAAAQHIPLTRGDVLGLSLPQNRNPNEVYHLSINALRNRSKKFITREGYTPLELGDLS